MTYKIREVNVEKYAYYVNKLRQNVDLETWKWRQIMTSQTAHTKYKWPPYDPEPNPPMKIFCARHCKQGIPEIASVLIGFLTERRSPKCNPFSQLAASCPWSSYHMQPFLVIGPKLFLIPSYMRRTSPILEVFGSASTDCSNARWQHSVCFVPLSAFRRRNDRAQLMSQMSSILLGTAHEHCRRTILPSCTYLLQTHLLQLVTALLAWFSRSTRQIVR